MLLKTQVIFRQYKYCKNYNTDWMIKSISLFRLSVQIENQKCKKIGLYYYVKIHPKYLKFKEYFWKWKDEFNGHKTQGIFVIKVLTNSKNRSSIIINQRKACNLPKFPQARKWLVSKIIWRCFLFLSYRRRRKLMWCLPIFSFSWTMNNTVFLATESVCARSWFFFAMNSLVWFKNSN